MYEEKLQIEPLFINIIKRNSRKYMYLNGITAEVNFLINPLSHNVRCPLLPPPPLLTIEHSLHIL